MEMTYNPVNHDEYLESLKTDQEIDSLLETPIEHLDLTVRAHNALRSAKIEKLSDLVGYDPSDLLKQRNFGIVSLQNLQYGLQKIGLTLERLTGYDANKLDSTPGRATLFRLDMNGAVYSQGTPAYTSKTLCRAMRENPFVRDAVLGAAKLFLFRDKE